MKVNDKQKLLKAGLQNTIELALVIPSKIEDRSLHAELRLNSEQVVKAEVIRLEQRPKILKVHLFSLNFQREIEAVIFHPKPFHRRIFTKGRELLLYGKIEERFGALQLTQPKEISSAGGVVRIYKSQIRSDAFSSLVDNYVSREALEALGLPSNVATVLSSLHFSANAVAIAQSRDGLYSLKFAELYNHISKMRHKRLDYEALEQLNSDISNWIETLPFRLTDDQQKAIMSIQSDLKQSRAARRMIVGDVGSGKTMVILASALIAYPKRSTLMAPTTLLANQLYEEAKRYLPEKIRVVLVTNRSKKESLEEYDFIIGTHALLHRELPFAPLVMVDEQHRFGTAQRNTLQGLVNSGSKRPHFLQFSATPIPRTQAMIDSALLDVTLIEQTPFKRNVSTKIIGKSDFKLLLEHIEEEIKKAHQVLIVYPLVEESSMIEYQSLEEGRGFWQNRFNEVYVTHGKDKDKNSVLYEFREKGNILLATTVVEVGISLPKLSTVVIVGAERLGLATLHQLRGRVSRTGLEGYCYLYSNTQNSKRLRAFSKTFSGFDIARLDLQFRQSGDLIKGENQSGRAFKWVDMAEDEQIVKDVKEHMGYSALEAKPELA